MVIQEPGCNTILNDLSQWENKTEQPSLRRGLKFFRFKFHLKLYRFGFLLDNSGLFVNEAKLFPLLLFLLPDFLEFVINC